MELQSRSHHMSLALVAVATVGACVLVKAMSSAPEQSTTLYTATTSGVSVARAPAVVSRSTVMGPRVGYPSMAAMPTQEADADVSMPIVQVSVCVSPPHVSHAT